MDKATFLQEMESRKGQKALAEWTSTVTTAAAHKGRVVQKHVRAVVEAGKAYANLNQNADRETGALPWGEWETFPFTITHKGADYLRLYRHENGFIDVTYTIDGEQVTAEQVAEMLTPSARERRHDGPTLTFTVKAENLTRIREATA